jgi:hypothetical protein
MCVGFIFGIWDVEINNDFEDITGTIGAKLLLE